MTAVAQSHKETLLIEILLTSLDLRASAAAADAPMLVYLAELLVRRTREELEVVAGKADAGTAHAD